MNNNIVLKINEHICLKQLELNDYVDIFNTINTQREYLGKWLPFVEFTKEPNNSKAFVEAAVNMPEPLFEYIFTIQYNNTFAGLIGFRGTDKYNRKTEIGYWIREELQGRGIVTKSVEYLCNYAFAELNINRIQIRCAVGNERSKAIPKKLGFVFEGIERNGELHNNNVFADLEVYSKLKAD